MNVGGTNSIGLTPGRKCVLVLDEPETRIIEYPLYITREADQIGAAGIAATGKNAELRPYMANTVLMPYIGWRINPLQFDLSNITERSRGQAVVKAPTGQTVATDYTPFVGTIIDDPIVFPLTPYLEDGKQKPLTVNWTGHLPKGCKVDIGLYAVADDLECDVLDHGDMTPCSPGSINGGWAKFGIPTNRRAFYVQLTLHGNSSEASGILGSSPTIQRLTYIREATIVDSGTTAFTIGWPPADTSGYPAHTILMADAVAAHDLIIAGITMGGQDEALSCIIRDFLCVLPKLQSRAFMRIQVFMYTEYSDVPALEFDGYFEKPTTTGIGALDNQPYSPTKTIRDVNPNWRTVDSPYSYPSPKDSMTEIQAAGPWVKIAWAVAPERIVFMTNAENTYTRSSSGLFGFVAEAENLQAARVTDVLKQILYMAGIQDWEMDIPDYQIRMEPKQSAADIGVINVGDNLWNWAQRIADEYLGSFIYKDYSRTTKYWRLQIPVSQPFTPLIAFTPNEVGAKTGITRAGYLNSYDKLVVPDGYDYTNAGSEILIVPELRPPQQRGVPVQKIAPETNLVITTSTGDMSPLKGDSYLSKTTASVFNPASFNAYGLPTADENSVDFLGGIKPWISNLPDYAAPGVPQLIARRSLDVYGHGYYRKVFESPAAYITPDVTGDPLQVRPRRPRYCDCALVWDGLTQQWIPWLFLCNSLRLAGDMNAMMFNELRSIPALTNIAEIPSESEMKALVREIANIQLI